MDGTENWQGGRDRVLVVGRGFLGTHVAARLRASGRPVRTLSRAAATDADDHVGDAGAPASLAAALAGVGHVVWCAGGLLPPQAEAAPERDATLTLQPLRTLTTALAGRRDVALTYLSSGGTVYGDAARDGAPLAERMPTSPIGAYGRTRLAAERLLLDARERDGLPLRILRCSNVYGPGQPADRDQGVVATLLARISAGAPAVVYGDGDAVRDFLHVADLTDAIDRLLDAAGPPLLNVGSGTGATISEVVALAEEATGRRATIVRRAARPFDVARVVLDTTLLRATVPFAPRPLRQGILELAAETGCAATQAAA